MKFILFNGAPGSGKDTAALAIEAWIQTMCYSFRWEKFSFPNKWAFAGMMNAPIDKYGNVHPYEQMKNEIVPELGVSYRQWQIDYSEKFMKPLYGKQVFAKLLLQRQALRRNSESYVCVISDCGFQVEVDTFAEHIDPKNCLLVRLERFGFDFKGDSREYVNPPSGWDFLTLTNVEKKDFEQVVVGTAKTWLGNHVSSSQ